MPAIGSVTCYSKSGKIFLPLTTAAQLPGKVPAFFPGLWLPYRPPAVGPDADVCCQTTQENGVASGSHVFAFNSNVGPPVNGNCTAVLTPGSDNGDGTWSATISASAVVTGGTAGATVTSVLCLNANPPPGNGNPLTASAPYITAFCSGILIQGNTPSSGTWSAIVHFNNAVPGFLYWTNIFDFANTVIYMDRARWDIAPNCVTSSVTQPVAFTGEVDYIFFKFAIEVTGLTPGNSYSIYLHFDGDDFGTGSWTTDEYEIEVDFVADAATQTILTYGLPVGIGVFNTGNQWPDSLGFTRFNRCDFTP